MVFGFDNLLEFFLLFDFGVEVRRLYGRSCFFLGRGSRELFCSELAHFGRDTKPLECLGVLGLFLLINTSFPTSNNTLLSTGLFI